MTAVAYRLPSSAARPGLTLVPPLADSPRASVYLRRRIVAALLASLLAVAVYSAAVEAVGWASNALATRSAPAVATAPVSSSTWTVRPGDTLWGIVQATSPGKDPRPLVQKMSDARGGAPLQVGERIPLP